MKKIKHSKEWYYNARIIAYCVGMVFCIVPTFIAGIVKLPLIATYDTESTLSGVFIVVLICAALPLYKALIKVVKSPNAAVICWVLFALMALVNSMEKSTIEGLTFVFAFAAVGNTFGAIAFKLSKEFEELWRYCGKVEVTNLTGGKGNG